MAPGNGQKNDTSQSPLSSCSYAVLEHHFDNHLFADCSAGSQWPQWVSSFASLDLTSTARTVEYFADGPQVPTALHLLHGFLATSGEMGR